MVVELPRKKHEANGTSQSWPKQALSLALLRDAGSVRNGGPSCTGYLRVRGLVSRCKHRPHPFLPLVLRSAFQLDDLARGGSIAKPGCFGLPAAQPTRHKNPAVKTMGNRVNGNPAGRTTTFRWVLVRWVRLTEVGGSRPCQKIRLNGTQASALSHSF